MELEIAPDGRIWFNEYGGDLKIYDPKSRTVKLAATLAVFKQQENGFLGFALDPRFAENGWIYCLYSPVGFSGQYLSRFTITADKLDLASEKILVSYEEQRKECCHHGGSVEFGPDGCLYWSAGDNTNPFGDSQGYAPIDWRPDRQPWDGARAPGNSDNLSGKVNRIRPKPDGTYEIPAGNLFPPGTPHTKPEIFAMGCRNPWRLSIDQKTGYVYWGEVGPDARNDGPRGSRGYDEINQARKAGYFGWPFFVGNNFPYARYNYETKEAGALYDPAHPVNDSPNNTGIKQLPPATPAFIYWPYAVSEQWPELGEGGRTACAGPVFHWQPSFETTNGFPKHFDSSLLFWDWQRPFIRWARLTESSDLAGLEPFAPSAFVTANTDDQLKKYKELVDAGATIIRRPVDATFGPDGCLYLLDYGETWGANADSALLKISYLRGNLQPIAKLSLSQSAGKAPLRTRLSAAGSRDLDGGTLSFSWKLQPSGRILGTGEQLEVSLDQPGSFQIELTVSDGQGGTTVTTAPIVVGNARPQIAFSSPVDGDFYQPGKPLSFKLEVRDEEDGSSSGREAEFGIRTMVNANFLPADGKPLPEDPGLALMRQSDCFNCHSMENPLVGPPFLAIADKYRKQDGAAQLLNQKVRLGGSGVWGQVPMLAHPQHSEDEVAIMLRWMLALEKGKGSQSITRGIEGQLTAPRETKPGALVLEAAYTDLGAGPAGPLTGSAKVTLRMPRIEAENTDYNGPKVTGSNGASNKKALGSTSHGHSLRIQGVNLAGINALTVRASVGGDSKDSKIEVRRDSTEGPLLATIPITHTGSWDTWADNKAPLTKTEGRHDLFLVLVNPGKGGLMNIDWIQFDR